MLPTTRLRPELTARERQILSLLANGMSQSDVAAKIFISPHTVNFHVRNILFKLTASNITAAVAYALSMHLIHVCYPPVR